MTRETPEERRSLQSITRRGVITAATVGLLNTTLATTPTAAQQDTRERWTFETGGELYSSPAVSENTVFIRDLDNTLYAVETTAGEQQWSFELRDSLWSSPVVDEGTVFVVDGTNDLNQNKLYAVNSETGEQRWAYTANSSSLASSPTVGDGNVFFANGSNLIQVDRQNGESQWTYNMGRAVHGQPTLAYETVFVGGWRGSSSILFAIDQEEGYRKWESKEFDGRMLSSPAVSEELVYVTVANQSTATTDAGESLYAFNIRTGELHWQYSLATGNIEYFNYRSRPLSSPVFSSDKIVVGDSIEESGKLHAIDAQAGEEVWSFETGGAVYTTPAVANGTVYVGTSTGELHAVDMESGEEKWNFSIASSIRSSPTFVDDSIYIGDTNGTLYALNATDTLSSETSQNSTSSTGGGGIKNQLLSISSPVAVAGGALVSPVLGYGVYQLIGTNSEDANTTQSYEREPSQRERSENAESANDEPSDSEQSVGENLREQADAALKAAETAKENSEFSAAIDAFEEALGAYQAALDELSAGEADKRTELEDRIESTRQQLDAVTNLQEDQRALHETLKPAERSLQEAIVAIIEDNHTVARIRFRQARDTFEDAHETIVESEEELLTEPVTVDVQTDREPPSTTLSELSVIPEAAATELTEAGIEKIDDLDRSDESPWTPAAVEELVADGTIDEEVATTLTLSSWWHGDENYTFETADAIKRRHEQADYGFNHTL